MSRPRTALVIGGGIVGLCSALSLQDHGVTVTLINDRPARLAASWGNAGHIAIEQTDPLASWATLRALPRNLAWFGGPVSLPPAAVGRWLPFGLRLMRAASPMRFAAGRIALSALLDQALPAWRRRVTDLGRPELLVEAGHLVVWEDEGAADRRNRELGRPREGAVSVVDLPQALFELLEKAIQPPIVGAIRYEGTASVTDPGAVLAALSARFVSRGGICEDGTATPGCCPRAGVDVTVITAGIGSAPLMEAIGHRAPIIAERGYHIQSRTADWPSALPPIVFADRSIVATGFTSGLRVTGFTEIDRPDAPPDPAKWKRLRRHAAELGLPFGEDVATWFGSRPTLPDYLPAIGRSTRVPRVLYAFGHQHLGLTLGPLTGEIIAALAIDQGPPADIAPFAIERF